MIEKRRLKREEKPTRDASTLHIHLYSYFCLSDLPLFSEVAVAAHALDKSGAGGAEPTEKGRGN